MIYRKYFPHSYQDFLNNLYGPKICEFIKSQTEILDKTEDVDQIANIIFGELPMNKKRIALRKLKKDGLSREYISLFLKLLDYINEF